MLRVLPKGSRIWADNKWIHKQGRAAYDIVLKPELIEREYADGWIAVKFTQHEVDLTLQPQYPAFWIEKVLTKEYIPPAPVEPSIVQMPSDAEVGMMFVKIFRWVASLFK